MKLFAICRFDSLVVGSNLDDEVWDATTFTKNRDRLLVTEVAKRFLNDVV